MRIAHFADKSSSLSAAFRVGEVCGLSMLDGNVDKSKKTSGPESIHMRWHTRNSDTERCLQVTGMSSSVRGIRPACWRTKAAHGKKGHSGKWTLLKNY